jgi:uncharacterized protein (DUF952 family)
VSLIYKICHAGKWVAAAARGAYAGSAKDREDGFLHFSTREQLAGTLARYYADATDLVLVAVDPEALGEALKWEPSRDGALFPHLYAPLPLSAVRWSAPIARDAGGTFTVPHAP